MKTPSTINELSLVLALKLEVSNAEFLKCLRTISPKSEPLTDLKGGTEKERNWGIAVSNLQGDRRHWILCIMSRNDV